MGQPNPWTTLLRWPQVREIAYVDCFWLPRSAVITRIQLLLFQVYAKYVPLFPGFLFFLFSLTRWLVTTLLRYTNLFIIIIVLFAACFFDSIFTTLCRYTNLLLSLLYYLLRAFSILFLRKRTMKLSRYWDALPRWVLGSVVWHRSTLSLHRCMCRWSVCRTRLRAVLWR